MSNKFDSLINPVVKCMQGGAYFLRPFAHPLLNFLHDLCQQEGSTSALGW